MSEWDLVEFEAMPDTKDTEAAAKATKLAAELANYGTMMPPASPDRICEVNISLRTYEWWYCPRDYEQFLMQANGTHNSGFTLLGTDPQPIGAGYSDDIFEASYELNERKLAADKRWVVLGNCPPELIVAFDNELDKYAVVQRSDGEVLFTYASIAEFAEDWLKRTGLSDKRSAQVSESEPVLPAGRD